MSVYFYLLYFILRKKSHKVNPLHVTLPWVVYLQLCQVGVHFCITNVERKCYYTRYIN